MQRFLALVWIFLLCSPAAAAPPNVAISYSRTLDTACALVRASWIKAEWEKELSRDLPLFSDLWAERGPRLLSATESITGKDFTDHDISARLTLCDLPSQSFFGISVNMRYALASFTPSPVPLRYKVGTLYHEILHGFVLAHLPAHSALLSRHAGEPAVVRQHLHLFALLKAVYLGIGAKDELAELVAIDGQLPGGAYKQAWQIVDQENDYLDYVRELRDSER